MVPFIVPFSKTANKTPKIIKKHFKAPKEQHEDDSE